MKTENIIIIALICLIFVVIGAYLIVNGTGTSMDSADQTQETVINSDPNANSVNTASQSSSQSESEQDTSNGDEANSEDTSSQETTLEPSSDSSAPQAGQAEGTVNSVDFD